MINLNRKVLSVTFTLLAIMMVASLACSVQAYSSNGIKKIPVTFTRGPPMEVGEVETCTKGALYIVKAELAFGTFIVDDVDGEEIYLVKQSGPLGTTTYRLNSVTGEGMAISEGILTFAGGAFKGIIITKGVFGLMAGMPFPLDVTQKGVWHGDGEYQGWTLVLQYTSGDDPIEGYMLVP